MIHTPVKAADCPKSLCRFFVGSGSTCASTVSRTTSPALLTASSRNTTISSSLTSNSVGGGEAILSRVG